MAVDSKNPQYVTSIVDWDQMQDTYQGQRVVKDAGFKYLPPTSGMLADGVETLASPGQKAYDAYRKRAYYPDMVREAVEAMVGVMHHKPPVIELPAQMEPLREQATLRNESLEMLLKRVNEQQLIYGRCGLLADMPVEPRMAQQGSQATGATMRDSGLPYIAMYSAPKIINWDQGRRDGVQIQSLNLVVLDEGENERQEDFEWQFENKWRVLVLGDAEDNEPQGEGVYRFGVFRDNNTSFNEEAMEVASYRGTPLNMIPFTFINTCDIVPEPDRAPLLGLSDLVLAIYRGEADYRQSLFMQGQDTLVTSGGNFSEDEALRVGTGGHIQLPQGGSAQFIGVSGSGLSEQRSSLENDYNRATQKGGQLLDSVSRQRESEDALKIRVAARTATLNQIAATGAFGLQHSLRQIAVWIGANPDEVVVTPNLDFVDDQFSPDDLVKLATAKNLGAPVSNVSIHGWLRSRDFTDLTLEEELNELDSEEPLGVASQNPLGPIEDEEEDDAEEDEEDEQEV